MDFKLYHYDVWGNKKDGFEVNNFFDSNIMVTLKDGATDEDIIQGLRDCGFLNPHLPTKNFDIEGDFDFTLYINYNSRRLGYYRPICEIRRIKETL